MPAALNSEDVLLVRLPVCLHLFAYCADAWDTRMRCRRIISRSSLRTHAPSTLLTHKDFSCNNQLQRQGLREKLNTRGAELFEANLEGDRLRERLIEHERAEAAQADRIRDLEAQLDDRDRRIADVLGTCRDTHDNMTS
jgi:hypothetical protein